jgi:hypothetical protein
MDPTVYTVAPTVAPTATAMITGCRLTGRLLFFGGGDIFFYCVEY